MQKKEVKFKFSFNFKFSFSFWTPLQVNGSRISQIWSKKYHGDRVLFRKYATAMNNLVKSQTKNSNKLTLHTQQAFVAQWLEHWSCKPGVESSNLSGGLNFLFYAFTEEPRLHLFCLFIWEDILNTSAKFRQEMLIQSLNPIPDSQSRNTKSRRLSIKCEDLSRNAAISRENQDCNNENCVRFNLQLYVNILFFGHN